MPNDNRDRSRFGSDDDRDYGRDRYSRGDESRGMFGYEGEGYMRGGSRDVERDFSEGHRGGYGRDSSRGDSRGGYESGGYNTGFSGGGYGTGERYGTGGSGRGAYGGGGYGDSGGGGSFGSRGGFSGVDRSEFGTGYSDRGADRGGEMAGGGYRGPRPAGYSGGGDFDRGSTDRGFDRDFRGGGGRGNEFRFNAYGDFNRGDYNRGDISRGSNFGTATDFDHGTTNEEHRGGGMMNRLRQSFRGRGPKGYQRSDDRIREDVCERLAMDDDVDASDIEVRVSGGTVTLVGTAPDRQTKRRAEDVAESVSGVHDVENQIRVAREETRSESAATTGKGKK